MVGLRLPPLTALRAFEAAARLASFKAAAVELSVTPTAISHQVRQLEAYLGARVLHRTPRVVALTAQGQGLYDAAAAGFAEIARATTLFRQGQAAPTLTLSATAAFLSQWLVPRLAEMRSVLPNLEVRLHASDEVMELRSGEIDVAIRYGQGPFAGVETAALREDVFAPVCSPRLGIASLADLSRAGLIHIDGRVTPRPSPDWPLWSARAKVTGIDTKAGVRFTDSHHALQAAIAGQGVAIVSLVLAADALTSGLLVQPFPQVLRGETYHLAWASGLGDRAEVAALRGWLRQALTSPPS